MKHIKTRLSDSSNTLFMVIQFEMLMTTNTLGVAFDGNMQCIMGVEVFLIFAKKGKKTLFLCFVQSDSTDFKIMFAFLPFLISFIETPFCQQWSTPLKSPQSKNTIILYLCNWAITKILLSLNLICITAEVFGKQWKTTNRIYRFKGHRHTCKVYGTWTQLEGVYKRRRVERGTDLCWM